MNANTIDKVWRTGIWEVNFVIYELKQIEWEWKVSMSLKARNLFKNSYTYVAWIENWWKKYLNVLYHVSHDSFHIYMVSILISICSIISINYVCMYCHYYFISASAKTNDFEIHHMNVCSCHRSGNWRNGGGLYVPERSLSYEWSLKRTKNVPCFVFQKASAGFVHAAMYLLRIDWKIAIIAVSWPFVRNEMETFCIPFQLRR